jgi:hypothetical protein
MAEPITESLMEISMIMADGVQFLKLRVCFEKWAKEAKDGKESSQTLVDMVYQFERLIKTVTK